MNKTYSLLFSITLICLTACASNAPITTQAEQSLATTNKDKPKRSTTSKASTSLPLQNTCEMRMTTGRRPLPIVDPKTPVLDHSKGFLPNGVITCDLAPNYSYRAKERVRSYSEKGSYQGLDYEVFFSRGNLELASTPSKAKWLIRCKKDEMEEIVTCSMNKGGFLYIHLSANGEKASFGMLAETYPNTELAVKVGNNTKVSASSMAGLMGKTEIIEQMKSNQELITSYYEWPSQVKKVKKHPIEGFSVALALMKKLHKESIFD